MTQPICRLRELYAPVGELTPSTMPTLTYTPTITFTFGMSQLVIRAPDLGNTERLHINRVYRESRGKTLFVFRQDYWPTYRIFNFTIRGLCEEDKQNTQTFLSLTRGKLINLLDYESRSFNGMIMSPDTAIQQIGIGAQYVLSLEFEGNPA